MCVIMSDIQRDPLEFVLCVNCCLALLSRRYDKRHELKDYDADKEHRHFVNMVCYKIFHNIAEPPPIGTCFRDL